MDVCGFSFLDVCIVDPQTCGYLDTRNCICVYRRCQGWIMLPSIYMYHIYIYTHVHEHTPLAKPSFCSGERLPCKPNNGALLITSINENYDSKSPNFCALLGTRTNSNNDSKSIGTGLEILALLLAVITKIRSTIKY